LAPRGELPDAPETETVLDLARRSMAPCITDCVGVEKLQAMLHIDGQGTVTQFALVDPRPECLARAGVGECIGGVAERLCFEPSESSLTRMLVDFPNLPLTASTRIPAYVGHGPIMLEEPRLKFPKNIHAPKPEPPAFVTVRFDITPGGRVDNTRVVAHEINGLRATTVEFLMKVAVTAVRNARYLAAHDAEGRAMWVRDREATIHFAR
jgi:hypothetical protein